MTRRLWLVLLAAVACSAQTSISTTQITAPASSVTKPTVLLAMPSGALTLAVLGDGIVLDTTTTPPTLRVTTPAPVATFTQRLLTMNADNTITANGIILLMRNGVTMMEGPAADYIRTSTGIKLVKQPTQPTDQWSCLCN